MKKDVPKLLKKIMEALEDTDSESDGELETPYPCTLGEAYHPFQTN